MSLKENMKLRMTISRQTTVTGATADDEARSNLYTVAGSVVAPTGVASLGGAAAIATIAARSAIIGTATIGAATGATRFRVATTGTAAGAAAGAAAVAAATASAAITSTTISGTAADNRVDNARGAHTLNIEQWREQLAERIKDAEGFFHYVRD